MDIKEDRAGDVVVLLPDGDLSTGDDCRTLEQSLAGALAAGARFVVLDCAKVGHLTSPALRALLLASRKLARARGRLVLCGMTAKVQKAFSISGFDRDFSVVAARDAAVQLAQQPLAAAPGKQARKGAAATAARPPAVPPPPAPPLPTTAPAGPAGAASPAAATPPAWQLALAARLLAALGGTPGASVEPRTGSGEAADAARRGAEALARALGLRPA